LRIRSLDSRNLRALADGSTVFGANEQPADIVVVTGPPGSGKTLFLQTIIAGKEAAAPYGGSPNPKRLIRYGAVAAKLTTEWWLDEDEVAFAGVTSPIQSCEVGFKIGKLPEADGDPGLLAVLARYDHSPSIGKVDYFPTSRAFEADSFFGGSLVSEQKFQRLSAEPRKYRGILKFLRALVMGSQRERWERVVRLFSALTDGAVKLAGLDENGQLDFVVGRGEHVGHAALSASAQQAFVFAGTVVMLELSRSVVLIDTPELYLPPGEAARRLMVLKEHAPSNQWIVATSDPQVIELASKDAIVRLGTPAEKK